MTAQNTVHMEALVAQAPKGNSGLGAHTYPIKPHFTPGKSTAMKTPPRHLYHKELCPFVRTQKMEM